MDNVDVTAGLRPAVGETAYVIGSPDHPCTLHSLEGSFEHGVAILFWREGFPRHDVWMPPDADPYLRGQAFDARVVTNSREIAATSRHILKKKGWNLP